MPRKLGATKEHELAPGVYVTRNSIIIDYGVKEEAERKAGETPKDHNPEEKDREHAPHEAGRPEGSSQPVGE